MLHPFLFHLSSICWVQVRGHKQTEAAARSEAAGEGQLQAEDRVSIVLRIARSVHRMFTFPLWAHQAFTPVGQRLYLNPSGDHTFRPCHHCCQATKAPYVNEKGWVSSSASQSFAPEQDLMPSLEEWKSKIGTSMPF